MSVRDSRLDVLRGLALWLMFTDHVPGNALAELTPQKFGLSDMADAFVLLSGVVCGLAYSRRLDRDGLAAAQRHALIRGVQIYAAYLITIVGMLGLEGAWSQWAGRLVPHVAGDLSPREAWAPLATDILLWRRTAGSLTILPMYLLFIAATPVLLWALRQRIVWLPVLSLGLYAAARLRPDFVSLPEPYRTGWYFNPAAWQVLFCGGLTIGVLWRRRQARPAVPAISRRTRVIIAAAAFALVQGAFTWELMAEASALEWSGKANLAPLRIVHLAAFGTLAWLIVSTLPGDRSSRIGEALRTCGRSPLTAYCVGVWLSAAAFLWLETVDRSWVSQIAVNIVGWTGCVGSAWTASRLGRVSICKPRIEPANAATTA